MTSEYFVGIDCNKVAVKVKVKLTERRKVKGGEALHFVRHSEVVYFSNS